MENIQKKSNLYRMLSFIFATLLLMVSFSIVIEQSVKAQDGGYWAQADRYGRYPCAGPATGCYVLPIIIVE